MDNMPFMSMLIYAVAAERTVEAFGMTAAHAQSSLHEDRRHVVMIPKEIASYITEI